MLWQNGYSVLAGLLSYVLNWDYYPMTLMGLLPRVTIRGCYLGNLNIIIIIMMSNNIVNILSSN